MKKNILIFYAVITSLSLISCQNSEVEEDNTTAEQENELNNPYLDEDEVDFFYEVDSRFINTITKEKLRTAKTLSDLVPEGATKGIESFREVKIGIVSDKKNYVLGIDGNLNSRQRSLLQSADYSTNFFIEAFCSRINNDSGEGDCFVYYTTIIPEKEAVYQGGHQKLMKYLKEGSKEETTNLNIEQLNAGKIAFTVNQNGNVENVKIESTSGYQHIDDKMMSLIKKMPNKWNPAMNANGDKIDQELVYSFGLIGC